MTLNKFKRPKGPLADLKELEYIIALHQTCRPDTRENATVSSLDVKRMLLSRYRLEIPHEQAIQVVKSLGGGDPLIQKPAAPVKSPIAALFGGFHHSKEKKNSEHGDADDSKKKKGDNTDGEETKVKHSADMFLKKLVKNKKTSQQDSVEDIEASQDAVENESTAAKKHYDMADVVEAEVKAQREKGAEDAEEEGEAEAEMEKTASQKPAGSRKSSGDGGSKQGGEDLAEEYLDLVQILASLLIPTIAVSSHEYKNGPLPEINYEEPQGSAISKPFKRVWAKFKHRRLSRVHMGHETRGPLFEQMINDAFGIMMTDLPADDSVVDEAFVEALLLRFGEAERAQNPRLVREMVAAARSSSGQFDREALVNALSSDLTDWDVTAHISTFFEDVFGTDDPTTLTQLEANDDRSEIADEEALATSLPEKDETGSGSDSGVTKPFFADSVFNMDMVVDSHAALWSAVFIWVFYILTALVYGTLLLSIDVIGCDKSYFWCELVSKILKWAIIAVGLSLMGFVFMLPLSIGNNPQRPSNSWYPLIAGVIGLVYSLIPFFTVNQYEKNELGGRRSLKPADILNHDYWNPFQALTLAIGCFLCFVFAIEAVRALVRRRHQKSPKNDVSVLKKFAVASSNARAETLLRLAATRKLHTLLSNAHKMHMVDAESVRSVTHSKTNKLSLETRTSGVLRNYLLRGEHKEVAGGLIWTWRRVCDGSLSDTEGIWINTRFIVMQCAQVLLAGTFAALLFERIPIWAETADEHRASMHPGSPQWAKDFVPTRQMVYYAFYPATIVATIVMLSVILIYLPSSVATVLKYRCQEYPSLGSPSFNKYRTAVDSACYNSVNGVWGMIGTGFLFWFIISLIIFLFQWPWSQAFMITLLAWCLGLIITICVKMMITMSCRAVEYRAFYRIKPRMAVLTSLALECWAIGIGGSVLISRVVEYLFAACLFAGRIDLPFLHEDINFLGYSFDYDNRNFVKDLLVHEAHRHPYLELLGKVYLMKLRHRNFVTDAGAAWRQLVVLAVFPWMVQHRVFSEERVEEATTALRNRQQGQDKDEYDAPHAFALGTAGLAVADNDATTGGQAETKTA